MKRGNNYSGARWTFSNRTRRPRYEPAQPVERDPWCDREGRTAEEIVADMARLSQDHNESEQTR